MINKLLSQKWVTVFLIIAIGLALAGGYWLKKKREKERNKDYVQLELQAIQTPSGWGYDITADKKLYIHQDIIPVWPGRHSFRTKEQALTIGQKVMDRVSRKQLPDVTLQDLEEAGIDTIQTKNP
jgi:Domain of unknown function (DUF4907)